MILVDSNVLMYAAGANHPYKNASVAFLQRVAGGSLEATIDAEILQEILHRYRALRRWKDGRRLYDWSRQLFPVVIPITAEIMDRARILLDNYHHLVARDALHAAVAELHGHDAICSYDRDFDSIRSIRRLRPADLNEL